MENVLSIEDMRNKKIEEDKRILEERFRAFVKELDEKQAEIEAECNRDLMRINAGLKGRPIEELLAMGRERGPAEIAFEEQLNKMFTPEEQEENHRRAQQILDEIPEEEHRRLQAEVDAELSAIYGGDEEFEIYGDFDN